MDDKPMFRPRFEPVINVGHILQTVTIASAVIAMMMKLSGWQVTTDLAIDQIQARAQKYIPVVEMLIKSDDIQNERMSNIATFIQEQRGLNNQILTTLGDIKTDTAILKARDSNVPSHGEVSR